MFSKKINVNLLHQKQSEVDCASQSELYMDRAYGAYVIPFASNPGLKPRVTKWDVPTALHTDSGGIPAFQLGFALSVQ